MPTSNVNAVLSPFLASFSGTERGATDQPSGTFSDAEPDSSPGVRLVTVVTMRCVFMPPDAGTIRRSDSNPTVAAGVTANGRLISPRVS